MYFTFVCDHINSDYVGFNVTERIVSQSIGNLSHFSNYSRVKYQEYIKNFDEIFMYHLQNIILHKIEFLLVDNTIVHLLQVALPPKFIV